MYAVDFIYDGVALSDFNFVIANFEQGGLETRDTGSKITLNLTSSNYGRRFDLAGSTYDTCLTCVFHICKDPEIYDKDEMAITSDEYRDISRWLNRRGFCKMQFITDEDTFKEMPYYNASFNVNKLVVGEVVYGIELTMQTDKPFGYFDYDVRTISPRNSTKAIDSNSMKYAINSMDIQSENVNPSYAGDLKMSARHLPFNPSMCYGADGMGANYTGEGRDTTIVPYYTSASAALKYAASNTSFTVSTDAEYSEDQCQYQASDITGVSKTVNQKYEIRQSFDGTVTNLANAPYTEDVIDGKSARVYSDLLNGDLLASDTVMCSVFYSSGDASTPIDPITNPITLEIYGTKDGAEVVAATFYAVDRSSNYEGNLGNYSKVYSLKVRRSDIYSLDDVGVYKVRLKVKYSSLSRIAQIKLTRLSTAETGAAGTYTWYNNLLLHNTTTEGSNKIYFKSTQDATNWSSASGSGARYKFYAGSMSEPWYVMFSDGLLWYHVFDTNENTNPDYLTPIMTQSSEAKLTSGQSVLFTNVFGAAGSSYSAGLVRKVTNGVDTYTQSEKITVNPNGRYLVQGIDETRAIAAVKVSYDDDFYSGYGEAFEKSAYIEYTYDSDNESTTVVTRVVQGTPAGILNGRGGGDYDNTPTVVYSGSSVYAAYSYPDYVYFDRANGNIYVSDGVLWHRISVQNSVYYVTSKLPINDNEMYTLHVVYSASLAGRTVYALGGVGTGDMSPIKSKIIPGRENYVNYYVKASEVTTSGTGQKYIQFKYPSDGVVLNDAKVCKVAATTGTPSVIIGYNDSLSVDECESIIDNYKYGSPETNTAQSKAYWLFLNLYDRQLYASDGYYWYAFKTVADSGSRITLFYPVPDVTVISFGCDFTSAVNGANGTWELYSSKATASGASTTSSSAKSIRYTIDCTSGDAKTFFENSDGYDKFVRYRYTDNKLSALRLMLVQNYPNNFGILSVSGNSWTTGQSATIGGYAANKHYGFLAMDSESTNLYMSDGNYWFFVCQGAGAANYSTAKVEVGQDELVTFSLVYDSAKSFSITKVEYGLSDGKSMWLATTVNYTSEVSGCSCSNSGTFVVDGKSVVRQGVYFVFPHDDDCTTVLTKISYGVPSGILAGCGGSDYSGKDTAYAGASAIYKASDFKDCFYIDQTNNRMYLSDGMLWVYLKNTEAQEMATSSVSIEPGESIIFSVKYLNAKSFDVVMRVNLTRKDGSSEQVEQSNTYSAVDSDRLFIMAAYSDAEIAAYGNDYGNTISFVYPYETGTSVSVKKVSSGDSTVINANKDIDYGYTYVDDTGTWSLTHTPTGIDSSYPAANYNSCVYANSSNGKILISDGEYWWLVKDASSSNVDYSVQIVSPESSYVSDGNRIIQCGSIGDDDIMLFAISYPDKRTFTIDLTRGLSAGSYSTMSLDYTDTATVSVQVSSKDAFFIGSEYTDGRYVRLSFPDGADLRVSCISKDGGSGTAVYHGYSGVNYDGMPYITDDYAGTYQASDYECALFVDEKNGYVYASDGINWHYLNCTSMESYKNVITDNSDEIGYAYPDVVVNIEANGRYVLVNEEFGTSTEINNCTAGEIITMHGETQIIETNMQSHDIAKDFNFVFLRIGNTYDSRTNTIKVSLPATTTIYHTPIAKDLT